MADNLVASMHRLAMLRDREVLTEVEYQRRVLLAVAAEERRSPGATELPAPRTRLLRPPAVG